MQNPSMVMIDVCEPYRGALRRAASAHRLEALEVHGELSQHPERAALSLAVLQANGPETDTLELVRSACKALAETPCVVLGAQLRPELAFSLGKLGVSAVIELPASEEEVVRLCLGHATTRPSNQVSELVGESGAMRRLRRKIVATADSCATVLLTGETGTGKGLTARAIHRLSRRSDRVFVQVDCSALSPTLIESELFGHERGAFTGAVERRSGRFELAKDGSIFLDEIGGLELPLQSKFLRVLEDREYERVGGTRTEPMTARVIAATSRDLWHGVSHGSFRSDLYYRLRVVHLEVPPLRDRLCDIPLLVESRLARISRQLEIPVPDVSRDFCDRLLEHPWTGNVRELFNILEAALVHNRTTRLKARHLDGLLQTSHPSRHAATPDTGIAPGPRSNVLPPAADAKQERTELLQLLLSTGGNIARVARRMGMPRSTVRYKIRRYDLIRYIPTD